MTLVALYERREREVVKARSIVALVLIATLLVSFGALTIYAHSEETHESKKEETEHKKQTDSENITYDVEDESTDEASEDSSESAESTSGLSMGVVVIAAVLVIAAIGGSLLVIKKL